MKQHRTQQQWLELIKRQQQSGLTAAQFCRNENLTESYFSTRKRQLLNKSKSSKHKANAFTKINIRPIPKQKTPLHYTYKDSTLKFDELPNVKWLTDLMDSLS